MGTIGVPSVPQVSIIFGTANSHRTQLPALTGVDEFLCYQNPPFWAMSFAGKAWQGDKMHTRHEGFLMPDECWPCRRNCTGPLLISAKTPPETPGHWLLIPGPQAQISTPEVAGVSGSHQTLPLSGCDNGPSLPQFPHLESGCSSTHHSVVLCKSLGGFINTVSVQTSFCSFSLFRIYLDGDPVSVGSWPQQSLPEIQPFLLPSRAGCCGGFS